MSDQGQKIRQQILKNAGIDAKNQQVAVHTLHQLQSLLLFKIDETCLGYLRSWLPELRDKKPSLYQEYMHAKGIVFQAVESTRDKITGNQRLVYCMYAERTKDHPEMREAFEINAKIIPQLSGKGLFRLDFDHKGIEFPADVKISKA